MSNLKLLIKRLFCKHTSYKWGWLCQDVKFKICDKCKLLEVEDTDGFKIITDNNNSPSLNT